MSSPKSHCSGSVFTAVPELEYRQEFMLSREPSLAQRPTTLFAKDHKPSKIIQGQGCGRSSRVKHLSREYQAPGLISSTIERTDPTSFLSKINESQTLMKCAQSPDLVYTMSSSTDKCLAAAVLRDEHDYFSQG